ncbi:MAG: phospholipid carrier-dependent glycosyltransferase [Pseudomonadota bacterium]
MVWLLDIALSLPFLLIPLVGVPVVRWWERRQGIELEAATRWAAAAALGIAWCQLGGMVLMFTQQLTALAASLWLIAGLGFGAAGILRLRWPGKSAWLLLPGLLLLLPLLAMALVPPWYQDDMTYHLALPRAFAVHGGYTVPDDNVFAFLPLGWESALSLLCALGPGPDHFPPFNPRLLGVWTTGFAALATVGLARSLGVPRRAAWLAGPLLLLHPTLAAYAPSAYVEPWLLLLVALAVQAAVRGIGGERGMAAPAGLFAGLAASCKFTGLAVTGLLGLALLLLGPGTWSLRDLWRRTGRFALTAALLGSPFYLRNWIARGNPVFPSYWRLLGGEGWSGWRAAAWDQILANYGAGRTPLDYARLPWRFFTTRELFDLFEGSNGPILGLGLLLSCGLLYPSRRDPPRLRALLAVLGTVLGFSVFWALSTQQMRFWLPALPLTVALAVAAYDGLGTRGRPWLLAVVLAGSVAWEADLSRQVWDRQHTTEFLSGELDADAVASLLMPDSHRLWPEVERLVPPDGRIWLVWMRNKTYYLRRAFRVDCVFEAWRFEELLDAHEEPAETVAALRADGITHMLIHHRFFLAGKNADLTLGRTARLQRRFLELVQAGGLVPLRRWDYVALYEVGEVAE